MPGGELLQLWKILCGNADRSPALCHECDDGTSEDRDVSDNQNERDTEAESRCHENRNDNPECLGGCAHGLQTPLQWPPGGGRMPHP